MGTMTIALIVITIIIVIIIIYFGMKSYAGKSWEDWMSKIKT